MFKGDISNEVSPRILLVFEGLLGILPDGKARAAEALARKARRWKRAARTYEINEPMARVLWDTVWRYKYSVDVATFLGDEMAEAIEEYLDDEHLPVGNIVSTQSTHLARSLAYSPDIVGVFHAIPEHNLLYGSKGYLVDPHSPRLVGAI